jgi:hypothetical protein
MRGSVQLLTAVPICDGHDSAINTLNIEFVRHGIEVVYLGSIAACDIARAAVQGMWRPGVSSYNAATSNFPRCADLTGGGKHIACLRRGGMTGGRRTPHAASGDRHLRRHAAETIPASSRRIRWQGAAVAAKVRRRASVW